jgi:hypothetical protein
MTTPIPARYRRLLATYPHAWRRQHETVVLSTLLEADEAAGRDRPTQRDRFALLAGGLSVRLGRRHAPLPILSGSNLGLLTDFHLFDQGNGAIVERQPTEQEQIQANEALGHSGESPMPAPWAAGMP